MKKWADLETGEKVWRVYWTSSLFFVLIVFAAIGLVAVVVAIGAKPAAAEQQQVEYLSEDSDETSIYETDIFKKRYQNINNKFRDEIERYVFDPCYRESLIKIHTDANAHLYDTDMEFELSAEIMLGTALDYYVTEVMSVLGQHLYTSNFNRRKTIYRVVLRKCVES